MIKIDLNPKKKEKDSAPQNPLNAILAKSKSNETKPAQQNPLQTQLAKPKSKINPKEENQNQTSIPKVQNEKYCPLENPPENFSQTTLDRFNSTMQMILDAMESDEIHMAMEKAYVFAQTHPELKAIIRPSDIAIFARGARKASGKVLFAKSKNRTKKSATKQEQQKVAAELDDILAFIE